MKLLFDFVKNSLTLEGEGAELVAVMQLAKEVAPHLSEIKWVTQPSTDIVPLKQSGFQTNATANTDINRMSLREFVRALSLSSLSEKIAGIAYFAKRRDEKMVFSPKEMSDWFTLCGFEKPSQMAVALSDGRRKAEVVENVGHGSWKISTNGENVIIRKMEENNLAG